MLIGKAKKSVERIIGKNKNWLFFDFNKSEKIKFKLKKLKKYQEKFKKKAKAGCLNKYQIQVKICQEYISEKFTIQLLEAKIFG